MRKIIPYILILLIFVNLFAPFSVGVNVRGKVSVKQSVAEAADMQITIQKKATENSIEVSLNISRETTDNHAIFYIVTDKSGTTLSKAYFQDGNDNYDLQGLVDADRADDILKPKGDVFKAADGAKIIAEDKIADNLLTDPLETTVNGKKYKNTTITIPVTGLTANTPYYLSVWGFNGDSVPRAVFSVLNSEIRTSTTGQSDQAASNVATVQTTGPDSGFPACWLGITEGISMSGCIAQGLYYLLFLPTSFLFALTGEFFDWTFNYSVQDSSYRSPFVVEGWGIVRDFCNMFFIFVLLYIAFSTILNIHGFSTKTMVVNVIIIGVLINFSLFAAQMIIDSSNILARVFYNSDAIKITKSGANGVTDATSAIGPSGEIQLSAALVNKVNPQNLIINARNVGTLKDKTGKSDETAGVVGVSNGTFILITLIATAVNVVGLIVFLSVGLIFISRVVGLWIYMILAPLAFFSYMVPSMQGLDMIGWKKWWSELLSLCFLAPIFIFFLYLILKFLEKGLSLVHTSTSSDGLQFVIGIIIPFVFIMTLLWQAKNVAKKMSGQIGQSITGGVAAIGGLALGGAALGAAALGRGTIGSFMKGASTGDTAARRLANNDPTLSRFGRMKGRLQQISGVDWAQQRVGGRLNRDQGRVEGYAHARKTLDDTAQARYHKKYSELTQTERTTIHDTIDNNIVSRQLHGNRAYNQLTDPEQTAVRTAVAAQRATPGGVNHGAAHLVDESRGKQGLASKIIQSTRNGSFDARNLSKVVANEYDRGFSKIVTGITSGLASGMRNAFKQSGVNYGTGQKDFFKDMGHTITEALKSASVKVDLSHVGEEHKEDGGHGGGGHH